MIRVWISSKPLVRPQQADSARMSRGSSRGAVGRNSVDAVDVVLDRTESLISTEFPLSSSYHHASLTRGGQCGDPGQSAIHRGEDAHSANRWSASVNSPTDMWRSPGKMITRALPAGVRRSTAASSRRIRSIPSRPARRSTSGPARATAGP
jgi:hypothetical protein